LLHAVLPNTIGKITQAKKHLLPFVKRQYALLPHNLHHFFILKPRYLVSRKSQRPWILGIRLNTVKVKYLHVKVPRLSVALPHRFSNTSRDAVISSEPESFGFLHKLITP
jgi:hypothetical protein